MKGCTDAATCVPPPNFTSPATTSPKQQVNGSPFYLLALVVTPRTPSNLEGWSMSHSFGLKGPVFLKEWSGGACLRVGMEGAHHAAGQGGWVLVGILSQVGSVSGASLTFRWGICL